MEERLVFFGIEYTKAKVPGTEAAQLFFYDPGEPFCTYNTHVLDIHAAPTLLGHMNIVDGSNWCRG